MVQRGEVATLNLVAEGRRAGFARSAHRRAAQARPGARRGAAVVRAPRRRRHHRVRRQPRGGVERDRHRLQRASRPQGARARRARGRRDAPLRGHLPACSKTSATRSLGMLKPEFEEVVTGEAEVREVFCVPRVGKVAGCYVRNGVDHPRLEGALPARGHGHLEGRDRVAAALQGRRARGARRASSAASGSRTTRTSSRATSSRPTTSARSPAPERASLRR